MRFRGKSGRASPTSTEGKKARNIGTRAHELVKAYLEVIATLQSTCDASGLSFTEKEIGSFSSAEIQYKGWWTFDALGKLGNVSLRSMTYPHFLARCKDLNAVMEGLKPGPLRSLLRTLGVSKGDVDQLQSLKLSAVLCQLATIAHAQHWGLVTDSALIVAQWDKNNLLDCLQALVCAKHPTSSRRCTRHPQSIEEPIGSTSDLWNRSRQLQSWLGVGTGRRLRHNGGIFSFSRGLVAVRPTDRLKRQFRHVGIVDSSVHRRNCQPRIRAKSPMHSPTMDWQRIAQINCVAAANLDIIR